MVAYLKKTISTALDDDVTEQFNAGVGQHGVSPHSISGLLTVTKLVYQRCQKRWQRFDFTHVPQRAFASIVQACQNVQAFGNDKKGRIPLHHQCD
jgi:hypothetical protein